MSNTELNLKVQSSGYNHGNSAVITLNNKEFGFDKYSRGLNIAVFDELTGQNISCTTFDTSGDENGAPAFAKFVEHLPANSIVAIAVKDDAIMNISEAALKACESLGSRLIRNLKFRGSYAMIGYKGATPGNAQETLSNSSAVTSERSIKVSSTQKKQFTIKAKSSGMEEGNIASINMNDKLVSITGGYQRGLNVACFNESNGALTYSQSFDLFKNSENAEEFAKLIEDLPTGRIVAIVVKDDATINLSERAKAAFKSIGSSLIDHLIFRGSYAIIGYKGAKAGSVPEHLSNYESAFVKLSCFESEKVAPPPTPIMPPSIVEQRVGIIDSLKADRASNTWHRVKFQPPFARDKKVVVQTTTQTFKGKETPGLRIKNVDYEGFDIRCDEAVGVRVDNIICNANGSHVKERIGWVAFAFPTSSK
ncbi:MAG: interleukin-like EMT inducer domain-containing protein [Microcoleaceae cyanobacterium MO_207.B10]|nr:interleukin-like EMT inducer domain-containing protein [Microcoleaceae cyanobacterium MO_207.B10]